MLMRTRCDVEQRSLSAVGVTHQCHIDGTPLALGNLDHLLLRYRYVFGNRIVETLVLHQCPCFFLADNFNHGSLLPAEGYLVSHDFIFDRIFKRGVQYHFYGFSFDESHFDDAPAESSVPHDFNDYTFFSGAKF